jgi:hypothetical protein
LSKNRYGMWADHKMDKVDQAEYAAAFFMLADQPRDAISVCLRQMNDWQLAVTLAKALEPDGSGPLLKWILTDRVVPMAFEGGHRWLASWAFWSLGRRDLSVRVLIVSDWARCHCARLTCSPPSILLLSLGHHLPSRLVDCQKMMTQVCYSCFNTSSQGHYRRQRVQVKSRPSLNSTLSCTTPGCSSVWVSRKTHSPIQS